MVGAIVKVHVNGRRLSTPCVRKTRMGARERLLLKAENLISTCIDVQPERKDYRSVLTSSNRPHRYAAFFLVTSVRYLRGGFAIKWITRRSELISGV